MTDPKSSVAETITTFDIAEHLETDADIQEFLREAANAGDASDFIHALAIAAKAKGMTEVAKQAGVTRASLYKSLADDGNPRFDTVYKVCRALGVKLHADPA
jgi:probable addiction module antidote protein